MKTTVKTLVVELDDKEMEKFAQIESDPFGTDLQQVKLDWARETHYTNTIVLNQKAYAELVEYLTK